MDKKTIMKDISNMEEVLERTAGRTDIWQDRLIHAMAKAIYHLLVIQVRKMN